MVSGCSCSPADIGIGVVLGLQSAFAEHSQLISSHPLIHDIPPCDISVDSINFYPRLFSRNQRA